MGYQPRASDLIQYLQYQPNAFRCQHKKPGPQSVRAARSTFHQQYILGLFRTISSPKLEKLKKTTLKNFLIFFWKKKKCFLYFEKWNFLAPSPKNVLYLSKKTFLYFIFFIRIFFIRIFFIRIIRINMSSVINLDIVFL